MRRLAVLPIVAAVLATAPAAVAAPTTLAIIGDTPYGDAQIARFPDDVRQIKADPDVSWVVHLGDIKNGSTVCSSRARRASLTSG